LETVMNKSHLYRGAAIVFAASITSMQGAIPATAATRIDEAVAAAAGAAAARAADKAVSRAVLHGAERYRGPACLAGAREFRLHGFMHAAFMHRCLRVL
jgi:hypothetical protein